MFRTAAAAMTETSEIPFHPVAEIFPMMSEGDLDALCADIRANGLQEPIFLADGQIADGRNRYNACRQAGVEPEFRNWDGRGDLTTIVVSLNLKRRHLDEAQRAMVASRLANLSNTGRPAANSANLHNISQSKAAEILNVSRRSVASAAAVGRSGVPELIAEVEAGHRSVSEAERIAKLPKPKQREIIKRGRKDQKAILRKMKISSLKNTAKGYGGCLHCNPNAEWNDQTVSAFAQRLEQRSHDARKEGRAEKDFASYFETISFEIEDELRADVVRPHQEKILKFLDTYECVEKANLQRLTEIPAKEFNDVIATMLDLNMIEAVTQGGKTDVARGARKTLFKRKLRADGELTYELDPEDDDDQEDVYYDRSWD